LKRQRQAAILRHLEKEPLASQRQIVEELGREGFEVSQTTVSRDLRELGVVKVTGPESPAGYRPGPSGGNQETRTLLRRLAPELLLSSEATGNMVVVKTTPGGAQGLAAAMDKAALDGVAGTVAGDDTVLVICSDCVSSEDVRAVLMGIALEQG
jgi:transcriptional regulator of arginine metabolism